MIDGGFELTDEQWQLSWDINVMAHVHAARAAMPGMLERGGGHFLNVLSAASLLTAPGAAAYASTKHAAIGFAEWLAIAHRSRGIRVSVVCPGAVRTQMLVDSLANGNAGVRRIAESGTILDPAVVAEAAITGVKEDRFLITSHEDTLANTQRKWSGPDRWVQAMAAFLEKASQ
jgi:NAD(P)-dependent dehydrogenase (short-subunit alcohol dehydrogenase family)